MVNYDSYTVYDNRTDEIIFTGPFVDVEDYLENPGRYSVVWDLNGHIISENNA